MWIAIEALIVVSALLFAVRERNRLHQTVFLVFAGAAAGLLIVDGVRALT